MSVMSERHSQLQQDTNEHGHPQTYLVEEDGSRIPVCSQCTCCVMPNRGQGTICETCEHEFNMHCAHDYDMGMLR